MRGAERWRACRRPRLERLGARSPLDGWTMPLGCRRRIWPTRRRAHEDVVGSRKDAGRTGRARRPHRRRTRWRSGDWRRRHVVLACCSGPKRQARRPVVRSFAEALRLSRYTLYTQDYGGPRFSDGIGASGPDRGPHRSGRCAAQRRPRRKFERHGGLFGLTAPRTRARSARIRSRWRRHGHAMSGNDPNVERYDPDLWTGEFAFLNQPGPPQMAGLDAREAAAPIGDLGQV
jgi:hypothetical protein